VTLQVLVVSMNWLSAITTDDPAGSLGSSDCTVSVNCPLGNCFKTRRRFVMMAPGGVEQTDRLPNTDTSVMHRTALLLAVTTMHINLEYY